MMMYNSEINKLAKQAEVYSSMWVGDEKQEALLEKFAELIVRECAMVGYKSKKLMKVIEEKHMRYSLVRERDGVGDSGPMCEILDAESYKPIPGEVYPRAGCGIRVGSPYGRTYSAQDYWQTTPITEIIDEWIDEDGYSHVKFKTKNSIYVWKEF